MRIPLRLVSTGKALPSQAVTASALDKRLGLPEGTVLRKGGVQVRHFATEGETQSALGAKALHDALQRANWQLGDVDLLIGACGVAEQALPSTSCLIAAAAGLPAGTPTFDVGSSCLSFLTALRVAASLLGPQGYRRIAVVSVDLASRGLDWSEPEASLIFGDGAAAALLEIPDSSTEKVSSALNALRAFRLETYPEGRAFCEIRAGGTRSNPRTGLVPQDHLFHMDGKAVFKLASQVIPEFLATLMAEVEGGVDSVDWVVPHQASHLGMAHAARKLDIPAERIINIYTTHGNQVAASLPTALHEALVSGRAQPGHRLLLMGTAAGLTVGGLVLDL